MTTATYCGNCRSELRTDDAFCTNCGHRRQASAPPPPDPRPAQEASGRGFAIGGIVSGAVALLFLPIILGPLGIFLGHRARREGDETLGAVAFYGSMATTVLGLLLGMAVLL